jgi:hypothetical protein
LPGALAGNPFSPSLWTARLQSIFAEHNSGTRISTNLLRDSFVTYAYASGISQNLKASIAGFMGHSVETAQRVYNRATAAEQQRPGVDYATQLARSIGTADGQAALADKATAAEGGAADPALMHESGASTPGPEGADADDSDDDGSARPLSPAAASAGGEDDDRGDTDSGVEGDDAVFLSASDDSPQCHGRTRVTARSRAPPPPPPPRVVVLSRSGRVARPPISWWNAAEDLSRSRRDR